MINHTIQTKNIDFNHLNQTTMKTGYAVFLMIELARCVGIIDKELEYDLTWETGCGLLTEFEASTFDDANKGQYDCMLEFLKNRKKDLVV